MTTLELVLSVISALDHCRIPYMVVGSLSSSAYGVERSTSDVDLVLKLGDESILSLTRFLPTEIHIDPQMTFETMTMTRRYVATIEGSDFKVEFFLLGNDPHDRERFLRRRETLYRGKHAVYLPSPEDVIVTKLRWGRAKDLDDIRHVIAVQDAENQLDWPYIERWCETHGTLEKLHEIRRSIPPI